MPVNTLSLPSFSFDPATGIVTVQVTYQANGTTGGIEIWANLNGGPANIGEAGAVRVLSVPATATGPRNETFTYTLNLRDINPTAPGDQPLPAGSYTFFAYANNPGRYSSNQTDLYNFGVPATPSFVATNDHTDGFLNAAEVANGESFRFTGTPGSITRMTFTGTGGTISNVLATEGPSGTFTVSLTPAQLATLGEGNFTVSSSSTNGIYTSSTGSSPAIRIDTIAPATPVLVPGGDHADGTIEFAEIDDGETFTFTAEAGSTVSVTFDGTGTDVTKTATEGPAGTFTVALTKAELENLGSPVDIKATATDTAGNASPPSSDSITIIPCFLPGTRIATPAGEAAVETLQPGDLVLTADGRAVAVRFLGRRTVSALFAGPERANPIRIAAGALAENVPARDLFVSPNHGIVVDGVLAFAAALVNGTTIAQVAAKGARVTYYSIETEGHEVILAEGCPAETFVDHVPRSAWDNAADYAALYPAAPAIVEMDLPHAKSRRQVPAETLARIEARAAARSPMQDAA